MTNNELLNVQSNYLVDIKANKSMYFSYCLPCVPLFKLQTPIFFPLKVPLDLAIENTSFPTKQKI